MGDKNTIEDKFIKLIDQMDDDQLDHAVEYIDAFIKFKKAKKTLLEKDDFKTGFQAESD